ncbi:helix-turn-helix domain-containing protein [Blastococcus mobilis]|uniref:helix-turn-helix domain-containing protein n=1 Tax=Blastococcus mobilis TaxID=1938746 RepID=UPI000B795E31
MSSTPTLRPHQRLSGETRQQTAEQLRAAYEAGRSIRQLSAEHGYSITRVRGLLTDAGVTFRGRGGANRRPRPDTST